MLKVLVQWNDVDVLFSKNLQRQNKIRDLKELFLKYDNAMKSILMPHQCHKKKYSKVKRNSSYFVFKLHLKGLKLIIYPNKKIIIIYSPSCHFQYVWHSYFHRKLKEIFWIIILQTHLEELYLLCDLGFHLSIMKVAYICLSSGVIWELSTRIGLKSVSWTWEQDQSDLWTNSDSLKKKKMTQKNDLFTQQILLYLSWMPQ